MFDFRPIAFILGILLIALAAAMAIPALAELVAGRDDWKVFAAAAAVAIFVGVALILGTRAPQTRIGIRQGFLLTTLSWLVLAVFGALPFAFADLGLSYTDALFESVSGITTTGSTVILGLDHAPAGILLWRSLLQWFGGIGVIVMAIAILPQLQIGGMQLFRMESTDQSDKALPRVAQLSAGIAMIYLGLTGLCAILYWLAGMGGFDAVNHAMTTIATGGFSTRDASFAYFDSASIHAIAVVFMLIGSLPFVLLLYALRGNGRPLLTDSQVRTFLAIVATATLLLIAWLMQGTGAGFGEALRLSSFNAVSIMTGTGYTSDDFGLWGTFPLILLFFLMFFGGCAGSTSCGLKIFRLQVLYANTATQMQRLVQPHGVFIAYFNRKPIPDSVTQSVLGFFFFYVMIFGALAVGLGLTGLDFLTALSGAATAIANVGPGLGETIGPSGSFLPLPDPAKWLLCAAMLLGRLELMTILILFTPGFWRQ